MMRANSRAYTIPSTMKLNQKQLQQKQKCQELIDQIFNWYGVVTIVTEHEARILREFDIKGEGERWMVQPNLPYAETA